MTKVFVVNVSSKVETSSVHQKIVASTYHRRTPYQGQIKKSQRMIRKKTNRYDLSITQLAVTIMPGLPAQILKNCQDCIKLFGLP